MGTLHSSVEMLIDASSKASRFASKLSALADEPPRLFDWQDCDYFRKVITRDFEQLENALSMPGVLDDLGSANKHIVRVGELVCESFAEGVLGMAEQYVHQLSGDDAFVESGYFDTYVCFLFRDNPIDGIVALECKKEFLRCTGEPLVEQMTPNATEGGMQSRRPAHTRDHLFLQWYEDRASDTYHRPATIRDKWNSLPFRDRHQIAPRVDGMVASADTVEKALARARREKNR